MNYLEAWQFLDNLQFFKIKLGLASMSRFLERLGSPHHQLRYVHVAGTNGKGSVSATVVAVLAAAGYKVGFYSSPHLSSVRERFRINNRFIDEASFARLATTVINVLDGEQITYFEFTTTLAFLWFQEQGVDLAVMEVGLGGRLDATNVITPLVSVITNIALDHLEYLGTTIDSIAKEKAGIIKKRIPVVCGALVDEAEDVVRSVCAHNETTYYRYTRDFIFENAAGEEYSYSGITSRWSHLRLKLAGKFQQENAAVALATIEILAGHGFSVHEDVIRQGLGHVTWPGRLELLKVQNQNGQSLRCMLDGAHNLAGVRALVDTLINQFEYKKLIVVWASMADKDFGKCLELVGPLCDTIIFTRPETTRSATITQLKECLSDSLTVDVLAYDRVNDAIEAAITVATNEDLLCVAGSLYLVGHARRFLCGEIVDG